MLNFAAYATTMNRIICLTVFMALTCSTAHAYSDHRNVRIDSLEAALQSSHPPKGKALIQAYDKLMRGYMPYDSKQTEYYGRKALSLSYELNALAIRQSVLRHLGLLRYGREAFDSAIVYFQQALAVADTMATSRRYSQQDVDDARSALYGSIANVYNLQDKAYLAIHYYQLALPLFERNGWLQSQAVLYHNIGELYLTMGNLAEAERNYLLAVEKGEASHDSLMSAMAQGGLAKAYIQLADYDKASRAAQAAYDYFHAHRHEEREGYSELLATRCRICLMPGHEDLSRAKAFAQEALGYVVDDMPFEYRSDIYAANSETAMAERQWQQALDYALKTIHPDSLATNSDQSCYLLLAQIYTELGHKDEARRYINKMYDMMNRYATSHYQSGLSQMAVLYETEKKDMQIATMSREQHLYVILLVIAAALLIVCIALFVYLHLAHKRQKSLLAARVALDTETKERSILARDLHDGLGGMLSLLRLKMDGGAGKGELLQILDSTAGELRRVSHHIMPEELLQGGLRMALADFAISVPTAQFHYFGNESRLAPDVELVLYRCAYELVNNAIKHAAAQHIDIQLMQQSSQVTLTVSDDGRGMAGTQPDNGMGLTNIRNRIGPYNGTLDIISTEGQGTEINVTLPL